MRSRLKSIASRTGAQVQRGIARLKGVGPLALFLISADGACSAEGLRTATLNDALSITTIASMAVSPDGTMVAFEQGGKIVVLKTDRFRSVVRTIEGQTPLWAPNGRRLAFYGHASSNSQLYVWDLDGDHVHVVTQLPDGISPDPWVTLGSPWWFSWAPDSRRLAFMSRRMPDYTHVGKLDDAPPIVVYTTKEFSRSAPLRGVIRGADAWSEFDTFPPDFGPARMRAVEKRPEFRFNHLFVVDTVRDESREVATPPAPFFPSWSPDGGKIAFVANSADAPVPEFGWATSPGELVVLDLSTGRQTEIKTPLSVNGVPVWSRDSKMLALVGQRRPIGFAQVQVYKLARREWTLLRTPEQKSIATQSVPLWSPTSNRLLYKLSDRFKDTLWEFDSVSGSSREIYTGDIQTEGFDQARNGQLFLVASSPTFASRLYTRLPTDRRLGRLLYDPSPFLSELRLGKQKLLTWKNAAGDDVDGIAVLPPDYDPGRRYPVIVDVYPRRAINGFKLQPTSQFMGQLEAARGYVVFLPALREPHGAYVFSRSENYTEKARGAAGIPIMIDDLRSGLEYLAGIDLADPQRVGLYGHSNGGYAVNLVITESNIGRCAVISAGFNNFLYPVLGADPPGTHDERTNGNLYENFSDYAQLSPILHMDRVHIPVLLFSGDQDWDWSLQMLSEFSSLRMLKKDATWVRYGKEGHYFENPEIVRDSFERTMTFFGEQLGVSQADTARIGGKNADCCSQASVSTAASTCCK